MTTVLDTSVLLDLLEGNAEHHAWSVENLEAAKAAGPILVPDIVYCEFSVGMAGIAETNETITALALSRCKHSDAVLFRAGKAFLEYRRNGGAKTSPLPDFLIGTFAEVEGLPLLTRDPAKVGTYFPTVQLICP